MKRRALGAVIAAVLTSALTGSLAWGDNPHGTPPGQAANDQTSASVTASASASAENKGQAKKAEESSQSSSSAGPSANASATAQANAAEHAQSNSSTSNASQSAQSTTKLMPGGDKFNGCTGTPNTSGSPGVKPGSNTDKWTCAKAVAGTAGAAADQTKRYGNGSTAGQGVVKRGGLGTTLYGPGNSQPHMVKPCPNSRHMRDWHAVKSFSPASCASAPATPTSTKTTAGVSSTTNTSVTSSSTTNTSVTSNSTTNTSVTNNSSVSRGTRGWLDTRSDTRYQRFDNARDCPPCRRSSSDWLPPGRRSRST